MGMVTRWWWIRHAPVTANHGCCYGQTDFPCDVDDQAALARLAPMLPQGAVWIASPLQRTTMTATALLAAGAAPPESALTVEPELIEQHFGAWQGVKYTELHARQGSDWHGFWLAPAQVTPPGGESFAALTARVQPAIERLNERHSGRDIVSFSHGGPIRAALGLALGLAPEDSLAFAIDNLSLTRIEHFPEPGGAHGWRVVTVNLPPR